MKIGTPRPEVWYRLPSGRLLPPYKRDPKRTFVGTEAGLLAVRAPPRGKREFDPARDELRAW